MSTPYIENLNRGRFETWTIEPQLELVQVKQVHGTHIANIETLPCEADGIMVSWEEFNKPLAVKTADCMPILIEGAKGVIFLHVGWRGLAEGILKRTEIGKIIPQRVLIAPSIHDCCFEVTPEFKEHFKESPHFSEREGKLYFNLQQEAKRELRELFPKLLIEIAPICTSSNCNFHSYRRDKTSKRNWNLYIKG